jgi:hypothetical protein
MRIESRIFRSEIDVLTADFTEDDVFEAISQIVRNKVSAKVLPNFLGNQKE